MMSSYNLKFQHLLFPSHIVHIEQLEMYLIRTVNYLPVEFTIELQNKKYDFYSLPKKRFYYI